MKKPDIISAVYRLDSRRLVGLLDTDEDANTLYQKDEFPALFAEQLNAPLEFDLTASDPKTQPTIETVHSTVSNPPRTFAELFHHPHPPIALLKLTKDYGKRIASRKNTALPWEIGYVIYATSLAVGLARYGERIGRLPTDKLRKGLQWSIQQPWVDEATRSQLQAGLERLK